MKIAVIPARGGSKRIPGKNIRRFHGKPIVAYSIDVALRSALFDRVVVSTDDFEIAEVAREWGAEVPFMRPAEIADDYTGTNAVVRHTLQWFQENGQPVQFACCIYATAPFLQERFLRQGWNTLKESRGSFAFSVTSFPFPIQRSIRINGNGDIEPVMVDEIKKRSQDLEETYHDAGQFYWGTAEGFLQQLPLFSSYARPVILPRHLVQDIDTLEDRRRAEVMYHALLENGEIHS